MWFRHHFCTFNLLDHAVISLKSLPKVLVLAIVYQWPCCKDPYRNAKPFIFNEIIFDLVFLQRETKGFESIISWMLREKWVSKAEKTKLLGQFSFVLYQIIFLKLHGWANWNDHHDCWKILMSVSTSWYQYASQQILDLFLEFTGFRYRVNKRLLFCIISISKIDKN